MGAILSLLFGAKPQKKNPVIQAIVTSHSATRHRKGNAIKAVAHPQEVSRAKEARRDEEVKRDEATHTEGARRNEEAIFRARFPRESEKESSCTQKPREDAEIAQISAEEQRRKDEDRAEETTRIIAEAQKAIKAMEEASRRLTDGIRPVVTPSLEELAAAKQRIQYEEGCFHLAIAGVSGSGKSSLVNAFRGVRNNSKGELAAPVGITETTDKITKYSDPNPEYPYIWYDIPGAGTLKCRDWQYFNDQGLYVFDGIIVLFDNRFTETDVAILTNARRFNIPTYIVRSKADQHINNMLKDMEESETETEGEGEGEGEGDGKGDKRYKDACKRFIQETKKSVETNLKEAKLPDQRVYIVSNTTLRNLVQRKPSEKAMDESDLFADLLSEAYGRRGTSLRGQLERLIISPRSYASSSRSGWKKSK